MKRIILTNWNIMRILRLIFGVVALVQGIMQSESLLMVAGVFILSTAIFNVGCCGAAGCSVPQKMNKNQESNQSDYEKLDNS